MRSLTTIFPGICFLLLLELTGCSNDLVKGNRTNKIEIESIKKLEAVAALGQLIPSGDVRRLAPPVTGFGGTPRISEILINEGDEVNEGQVLAIFDSLPRVKADIDIIKARLISLEKKILIQENEVSRYGIASKNGAAPIIILEEKQKELIQYEGQRKEAIAELKALEVDFIDSQLKSPIDGIVLKIFSREGERPSADGVLEVGSSQSMEALIEVYESDIRRVYLDQGVKLISENGGFEGTLNGRVVGISPQVRQRKVLSTDPTGDADARVVEVRVKLDQKSSVVVSRLTGMKVIARFVAK